MTIIRALLAALALALTACGGDTNEDDETPASTQPVKCPSQPERCR